MKKTLKLDLDLDVPGLLFALSAGIKAYKMAYRISREFNIRLKREKDLKFSGPGKRIQLHLNYFCDTGFHSFRLIENRGFDEEKSIFSGPIFAELKDFDFIFYCESRTELNEADCMSKLRKLEGLNLVAKYDPNRIKNRDYLIPDQ